jgi:hypothetical protein
MQVWLLYDSVNLYSIEKIYEKKHEKKCNLVINDDLIYFGEFELFGYDERQRNIIVEVC